MNEYETLNDAGRGMRSGLDYRIPIEVRRN
jgi:hypothetical protein